MRLLATLSFAGAALVSVCGVILTVLGFTRHEPLWWIIGLLVLVLPWVGAIILYRAAMREGRSDYDRAIADNFAADHQGWFMGSGIAADIAGRKLLLSDANRTAVVPFETITGYRYKAMSGTPTGYNQGLVGAVNTVMQVFSAIDDYNNAGLFVTADSTTWRIIGVSKGEGTRWLALLGDIKAGTANPSSLSGRRPLDSAPR